MPYAHSCTRHAVEDDLQVLSECPPYQQIRHKYGSELFSRFGDALQSATRVSTRDPGKVPEFVNQEWWHALLLSACTTLAE
jgi:hypothetical protein